MPIRLAKVLCLVSMRRSAEEQWRNNWDFQSENITYCVIIHAIHYILWHENWLKKYSNSLFNLSALRYLIARNEGGRNDTLWPKLVAVSCIQSSIHHTAICLPTIKTHIKHTSKLIHKNVRFCCDNRFELWLWSVLISIHLLLFWLSFVLNAQQLLQLMQFAKRCHCYCDVVAALRNWAEHTARKKTQNFNHWR